MNKGSFRSVGLLGLILNFWELDGERKRKRKNGVTELGGMGIN